MIGSWDRVTKGQTHVAEVPARVLFWSLGKLLRETQSQKISRAERLFSQRHFLYLPFIRSGVGAFECLLYA